jgi:PEP-CTERM motif
MKSLLQIRIASFCLLTILCLMLASIPASAQATLYDNGPINGNADTWQVNFGYVVSDSFTLSGIPNDNHLDARVNSELENFTAGVWELPGDKALTVDWSITSQENGGTVFGSGTANVTDTFISVNEYGYNIDKLTASGLNVTLDPGTYWLNLQNAATATGDPIYWDENSGVGCGGSDGHGADCPSQASESALGTVPAEAFTIQGTLDSGGSTPEPSSLALFGSGVLGIGGLLRRRFLG